MIEIEDGAIRGRSGERERESVCQAHTGTYTSIYRYLLPEKLIPARLILGRRYPLDPPPPLTTATDRHIIFDREQGGRKRARDRKIVIARLRLCPSSNEQSSGGNEDGTG